MDVISNLRKKRQEVTAFEVEVREPREAEHPLTLNYHIYEGDSREERKLVTRGELTEGWSAEWSRDPMP